MVGLTRTAALEQPRGGVRFNAACPGATDTPMHRRLPRENPGLAERTVATNPSGRVATVDEAAAPIAWLLSEEASFVTGVALPIDGGLLVQ